MFDVLEHIPTPERPSFLAELYDRLAPEGLIFASTPYPNFTRHRRAIGDEGLQVVDEEIELPQLLTEAECLGLQLIRFEAYDVFAGTPEYQIMVFTPERAPGGDARLRSAQLDKEMRAISRRGGRWLRRARYAARMLRSGERPAARWFLTGRPPRIG